MNCPVHLSAEMVLVNSGTPIFGRTSHMDRTQKRAAKRMIYRCSVAMCPRVEGVEEEPQVEMCATCGIRPADPEYVCYFDFRCRICRSRHAREYGVKRRAKEAADAQRARRARQFADEAMQEAVA